MAAGVAGRAAGECGAVSAGAVGCDGIEWDTVAVVAPGVGSTPLEGVGVFTIAAAAWAVVEWGTLATAGIVARATAWVTPSTCAPPDTGDLLDAGAERNANAAVSAVVGPVASIAARGDRDADLALPVTRFVPRPCWRPGSFAAGVVVVSALAVDRVLFVGDTETAIGTAPECTAKDR